MTKRLSLSRAELTALGPCGLQSKLLKFGDRDRLTIRQAFAAGFTVSDLLWVAGQKGLAVQCVRFALETARTVAHHNPDLRVKAALDATQDYLDAPSLATAAYAARAARAADAAYAARAARAADAARAAARAAYAAAYAADAVAYAARAAYAAAYAAYAAAYAAYAVAYAARAAYAAADAAYAAQQKLFIKIFNA